METQKAMLVGMAYASGLICTITAFSFLVMALLLFKNSSKMILLLTANIILFVHVGVKRYYVYQLVLVQSPLNSALLSALVFVACMYVFVRIKNLLHPLFFNPIFLFNSRNISRT